MKPNRSRPANLALAGLLLASLAASAPAALLTLDPLVNGDFEQNDISNEANELAGWAKDTEVRTVETNDFPTWANTAGVASQVGMLYDNSGGTAWAYQGLTGTSDTNGASHALTTVEAVGNTINVSIRLGIQSFGGWQSVHSLNKIGFQNQSTWEWVGLQTLYTGTEAQAIADGVTADVYLSLDDADAGGASTVWTYDYTIADVGTTTNNLIFGINTNRAAVGNARLIFDDVALTLGTPDDTDGDGISDFYELAHTDPPSPVDLVPNEDDDDDGLTNLQEFLGQNSSGVDHGYGQTSASDADSDDDTIDDGDETDGTGNLFNAAPTNPLDKDSDTDGIEDAVESAGTLNIAYANAATNPNSDDTDSDGMDDLYEVTNNLLGGLDPNTDDAAGNLDGDPGLDGYNSELTNLDEYLGTSLGVQTRADMLDTDADAYPDHVEDGLINTGWGNELGTGTNPVIADSDGDGLEDGKENPDRAAHNPPTQYKTDPNNPDSDGDGWSDGEEVNGGSDPDNINSVPSPVILTLDPLVNGDFEQDDVPAGENNGLAGWTAEAGTTRTVETDDGTGGIDNGSWNNTPGAASQVGTIFVYDGDGGGWFYQNLTGTSNVNPTNHTLTGKEAAGQTFSLGIRIGIQAFSEWPTAHGIVVVCLQNQGTWEHLASRTLYTGTKAQAMATGVTADAYLGLDETDPNGASTVWTGDLAVTFNVPDSELNSGNPMVFAVNLEQANPGDTARAVLDDATLGYSGTTPAKPLITSVGFGGGDLKITFSPGGAGFILTSSDDLVGTFTEETNATYDGTDTFTVPAAFLNPGHDFFRVETAP